MNSAIPQEQCKVVYPDFADAIKMCIAAGKFCAIAKSDMSMAFRNVPLSRRSWRFFILKAEHPVTKKFYYFVDKCLPFGSSKSCKIFQDFSDSVAHIFRPRTGIMTLNYLDDYFFVALLKAVCDGQVQQFLDICNQIRFPVSIEKTYWGRTVLVFLGLMIDTIEQVVRIPKEKIDKALAMTEELLVKKKGTVLQIQKLCGTLNFLCKCVIPGRVFLN